MQVRFWSILGLIVLTGCATNQPAVMSVDYGTVVSVSEIDVGDTRSSVAAGATVGGIVGLGTSSRATSGRQRRSLAIGSALGAAAGAAASNQRAFSYTVDLVEGGRIAVVTEQDDIQPGDCVSVERGANTANIREVASVFCDTERTEPYEKHVEEAGACEQAKMRLLEVPDDELASAVERVRILCDD